MTKNKGTQNESLDNSTKFDGLWGFFKGLGMRVVLFIIADLFFGLILYSLAQSANELNEIGINLHLFLQPAFWMLTITVLVGGWSGALIVKIFTTDIYLIDKVFSKLLWVAFVSALLFAGIVAIGYQFNFNPIFNTTAFGFGFALYVWASYQFGKIAVKCG